MRQPILILFFLICGVCFQHALAQKGTDHDKFARKFYQHYSYDESKVQNLLPDVDAIAFISTKTGESIAAIEARIAQQRAFLKSDLSKLGDRGQNKKNVIDGSRIEIKKEEPVRTADIFLSTHWGNEKFVFLLQNCIQTDKGWFLGDFVGLQGDAMPDRGAALKKEIAAIEKKADDAIKYKEEMEARELADKTIDLSRLTGIHWTGTYIFGRRDDAPFFFNASSNNLPEFTGKQYPDLYFAVDGKCEGKIWLPGPDLALSGAYTLENNIVRITGANAKANYEIYHVSLKRLVVRDMDKNIYYTLQSRESMESESAGPVESAGTGKIKPWVGPAFPMQGAEPVTQYFKMELVGKPMRGFYIDKNGRKINSVIKYQDPEDLCRASSTLLLYRIAYDEQGFTEDETNNFVRPLMKDSVVAFFIGEQVFVRVETSIPQWGILRSEGAIRQVAVFAKAVSGNKSGYATSTIIDKLGGKKLNAASLTLSFKSAMADLVSDNQELAANIANRTEGYRLMQLEKIIAEYNAWYDTRYPGVVQYLFYENGAVAWRKK